MNDHTKFSCVAVFVIVLTVDRGKRPNAACRKTDRETYSAGEIDGAATYFTRPLNYFVWLGHASSRYLDWKGAAAVGKSPGR